MTDMGRKWDGSPASVRVVGRSEIRTARRTELRDMTPGGVRQYDIVYPPDVTPGPPRGHPQTGHIDYSGYAQDRAGYAYEYPRDRATQADRLKQLERQLGELVERVAELERKQT